MSKIKRLSDYTDLTEEFIQECRELVIKFEGFLQRYVDIQELEIKEQIEEMENLKREHTAELTYALRHFSQIAMYRENFEFLGNERKTLKSSVIEELMKSGSNAATAERICYNSESYKNGIKDLQEIRKFLIYIYELYDLNKSIISRNIHQSLATLQKEAENLKRS